MALLGRAYEPREDYYLGWFGGLMNDPFSLRDDVDRLHVRLGFMVALPMMLLGAWASKHFHSLVDRGWLRPSVLVLSSLAGSIAVIRGLA